MSDGWRTERAGEPVAADRFPAQHTAWLDRRAGVCFDYDTSRVFGGTVVRCDSEHPGVMIIRLDDGRHVLSTECQYTFSARHVPRPPISVTPGRGEPGPHATRTANGDLQCVHGVPSGPSATTICPWSSTRADMDPVELWEKHGQRAHGVTGPLRWDEQMQSVVEAEDTR